VRDFAPGRFTVGAVVTTLDRTHIAAWTVGTKLNLERALAVGDRLGGHIVQGHVDGVGTVERAERRDDAWILDVRVPEDIDDLLVPRGSIAVDGVSLTVVELPAPSLMRLSIIEHTMRHTTLGSLGAGSRVHLEGDILAKHIKRLAAPLLKS
jgi:riboflavin synthase